MTQSRLLDSPTEDKDTGPTQGENSDVPHQFYAVSCNSSHLFIIDDVDMGLSNALRLRQFRIYYIDASIARSSLNTGWTRLSTHL